MTATALDDALETVIVPLNVVGALVTTKLLGKGTIVDKRITVIILVNRRYLNFAILDTTRMVNANDLYALRKDIEALLPMYQAMVYHYLKDVCSVSKLSNKYVVEITELDDAVYEKVKDYVARVKMTEENVRDERVQALNDQLNSD